MSKTFTAEDLLAESDSSDLSSHSSHKDLSNDDSEEKDLQKTPENKKAPEKSTEVEQP